MKKLTFYQKLVVLYWWVFEPRDYNQFTYWAHEIGIPVTYAFDKVYRKL